VEPAGNLNVPKNDLTAQMQAALRMFQSRRTHTCPGCGRLLGQRDERVRVVDLVYHRSCAPRHLEI
jgi:predicted RNA-binding Zn-ribbon protein involved in translation (DUF1610 family)